MKTISLIKCHVIWILATTLSSDSEHCNRAPCYEEYYGCRCRSDEGHPELATLVEEERQRRGRGGRLNSSTKRKRGNSSTSAEDA